MIVPLGLPSGPCSPKSFGSSMIPSIWERFIFSLVALSTNCWANWLWEWLMIPTLKFTVWFLKIEPKTKRKISGKRKVKNSDTLSRRKRLWKACTWPRIPVQYLFIVSP